MEVRFFTYQQRYRGEKMDIKFELKKCPFCGGEAQMIIAKADTKLYGVECKRCHVLMGHTVNNSTEFFTMPLYAADAWNQRAAHLPETKADIPMPEVKEPKKSSQAAAGHWIPVKDEAWPSFLEDGKEYLISTAYNSVRVDVYCEDLDENGETIGWFDNTDADDVVAIMELPEPYKGQQGAETKH